MKKILLIEDNHDIRQEMAYILSREGYEVKGAENGEAAFLVLEGFFPDLIFCDQMMPQMDGKTFLAEFRKRYPHSFCQIVFLTALGEKNDIRSGMTSGADDYLVKPVTAEDLLATARFRIEKGASLSQQMADLSEQILYALPHEIRTPLTGIIGFCDMILKDPEGWSRNEIVDMIDGIEKSSKRLYRVLENYLTYVSLKLSLKKNVNHRAQPQKFSLNPHEVETFVISLMEGKSREKNLLSLSLEEAVLCMDAKEFFKVLEEITDNALKFSERGTPLFFKGEKKDDFYELTVSNQGREMPKEMLEKAGIPFVQSERKKYEQQGLGLGLALVRLILKIHGGTIQWQKGAQGETETRMEFPLLKVI